MSELCNKATISLSFFDGIEITSLKIFNKRETEQLTIIELFDNSWNRRPSELGCCAQPSSSGNLLVRIRGVACPSYGDVLQQTR